MYKDTKKQKTKKQKDTRRKPITNFFGNENDEARIQRQIAENGRIGGVKLG